MIRSICITLCLAFSMVSAAFAEEPLKIVVAHDATWPPMEYIDKDRKIVGYSVDYIDAVAKEANLVVEHKSVAWDGIFSGLAAKRYDVIASSVTITETRKKSLDFSNSYYEVKQALVVPKGVKVQSMDDLKGKRIGAQIGTMGFFAIKENKEIKAASYDEIGLAMEALASGRIDGVVCDDPTATNFILANKKYAEKMEIAMILPAEPEDYGFAVRKGNKELVERLNKGIAAVKSKGIEQELIKKWISPAAK